MLLLFSWRFSGLRFGLRQCEFGTRNTSDQSFHRLIGLFLEKWVRLG